MAMDEVRRRRATSFGSIATDYDRVRPEPPAEAIDWLLPEGARRVAEVGAGTGALTRRLVPRVDEVIAVEPDNRMRAVLEERAPAARIVDGTGEHIPLPDAAVDAVLAASSWHWVEQDKGFAEVARVLRPGGVLGLLWTGADRTVPWVSRLMAGGVAVDDDRRAREEGVRRRRHQPEMPEGAPFGAPEVQVFRSTVRMTPEDLAALPATYSVAIVLDPDQRRVFTEGVERFIAQELVVQDGLIELPIGCVVWKAYRD